MINKVFTAVSILALSASSYAAAPTHHLNPMTIVNSSSKTGVIAAGMSPYAQPSPCIANPGGSCRYVGLVSDDYMNYAASVDGSSDNGELMLRVTPVGSVENPKALRFSFTPAGRGGIAISPSTFLVNCTKDDCPLTIRIGQDNNARFYAGSSGQVLATTSYVNKPGK